MGFGPSFSLLSVQTLTRIGVTGLAAATLSGCAFHYRDAKSGTEHIWGIGHMKLKVAAPNEGLQAVVHGTDVFGFSVGKAGQHAYLTTGWHRLEFIEVVNDSATIRIERPAGRSFDAVRIGSQFPLNPPPTLVHEMPAASLNSP